MATCVTFICLKQAYEKLQVFDGIFSKGGARKNRNMAKQNRREMAGAGEGNSETRLELWLNGREAENSSAFKLNSNAEPAYLTPRQG